MGNAAFLLVLGGLCAWVMVWGGRNLPREEWQFLASVPVSRREDGNWRGTNLTFYGFFVASASVAATGLALAMVGAAGAPAPESAVLLAAILSIGIPLSRHIARGVEGKSTTFTVGGAYFASLLLAPFLVVGANRLMGGPFDVGISLAALTVAFAFGEGLGRLACLSFGCCYGRRIQDLRPGHRRLFSRFAIRFTGETKKIAYERNGQDIDVVPIQLVTAGINLGAGLLGLLLFLNSRFRLSFLSTALMIQGWRFASEFLRADDRGGGRWSAYQWMSLLASLYVVALGSLLPSSPPVRTDILAGVRGLWEPSLILGLEALWASLFLFTGKSRVTGSHLIFFVRSDGARGAGDPGA